MSRDICLRKRREYRIRFRRPDRLLIQAHPFRNGCERMPSELLDGLETFNMHPNHNSRVALAALYAREQGLLPVAGSDYHHPGQEGVAAILTREPIRNSEQLVKTLRSGEYRMEIGGCVVLP